MEYGKKPWKKGQDNRDNKYKKKGKLKTQIRLLGEIIFQFF